VSQPVAEKNTPRPGIASSRLKSMEGVAKRGYVVDANRRLVSVKFGKKVTVADIEGYAAALRANPLFNPDFSEIVDLSHVEELDLKAEEFIRLADEVDPFSLQAKRAFIVRNSVQAHAARMHKILRTQRNFSIFHSAEEAEKWIGS
jgi:hypothetical protein